jgi:REP element-mobilizing transposase RayT
MGTLKGKLAIKLFKSYPDLKKRPYWGNHFWAKGYFVSTVGLDSEMINDMSGIKRMKNAGTENAKEPLF